MAVITIPISLLWKVKISLRQKVALMSIFSVTVIIMIFAIVRVAMVESWSNEPDESWLYLWSSIEQTVCMSIFPVPCKLTVKQEWLTPPSSHHDSLSSFLSCLVRQAGLYAP